MNKYKNYSFLILGFLLFLSSCVSKKELLYFQDIQTYNKSEVISSQNILQENDILKIDVTSLEMNASIPYNKVSTANNLANSLSLMQLNGYLVSTNKTINFPILGEISVSGNTPKDLEKHLKNLLETGGHLKNPRVIVRLLNSKVTILGEVRNPGTFTFTEKNISLLQALGLAGDLTIDGNRKNIIVIRESNGQRTTTNIDLTSAIWLSSPYQNIQPNDVIIVNPNSKKITSAGLIGNISTVLSIASILLSTIILIK
ncbi:polysaccharide biosynthesis/export family protein [Flavobacteriaceae bacterium]|nr:polysaccharide biosynthesis/export family protein [Flavobacteriaceae bacterium]